MNMYIGNLAYNVTEEDLNEAFSEFGNVESVKFVGGPTGARIESTPPYFYGGGWNGNIFNVEFAAGQSYTITATPYSENGAQGSAGTPLTITITTRT